MNTLLLESRPFRPFKSSEEYLYAMKEDLAEWLQIMYPHLNINVENFMEKLETGVALCEVGVKLGNAIDYTATVQSKELLISQSESYRSKHVHAPFWTNDQSHVMHKRRNAKCECFWAFVLVE
ncbi:hypothetical protein WA026_002549 [Henosepilachna vigintioctopunctata]|uniref:GAS2-like protein 2 n=1 Tax=Henosepilachna vigintioctopunctata TaxID=420089 RepID=A0AAW1TRR0_9CUCU